MTSPSLTPAIATESRAPAGWDEYVARHPQASAYHHSAWSNTVADLFRLDRFFLHARGSRGAITGVLPLLRQRSLVFGDRLTSLPYFNSGGTLADDPGTRQALMHAAVSLAQQLKADQLELRDTCPPPSGWPARTDKVTLVLDLPGCEELLSKQLGSKLRSQIKRAQREPVEVKWGGAERVGDFYAPFCSVMHGLGTPVYPVRFFEQLAERMADQTTILAIHLDGQPVSAAFLVRHRDTLEIPWAATIAEVKSKSTNMLLYWEVLRFAIASGCTRFDFGRSTVDSGPYRFKQQWGAQPVQLHWAYWRADRRTESAGSADGSLRQRATKIWSRLPLTVANRIGPLVSPTLPW